MNLKIKKILFSVFFISVSFLVVSPVLAQKGIESFNKSLEAAGAQSGHDIVKPAKASDQIYGTIAGVIKVLLSLLGIVFIVLIIYAGYTWMMARGDEAEAQKAKNTITRAIIGLAIVLGAYAITTFIGGKI